MQRDTCVDDGAEDPFAPCAEAEPLASSSVAMPSLASMVGSAATVARLHGFDLLDRPLVGGLPQAPGLIVAARATLPIHSSMIGAEVVLLFEGGELERPIIVGIVDAPGSVKRRADASVQTRGDDPDRRVIRAEREIVLRCGAASITLTRSGRVVIEGRHVVSRSSGCNRILGAAVDIN